MTLFDRNLISHTSDPHLLQSYKLKMLTLLINFCPVVCVFLVDCRPAVVLFMRLVLGDGLKGSTPCLCAPSARFRGGRGEEEGADAARCAGALLPESPVGKVRP